MVFLQNIFGSTIILMFIFDVVVDIILHILCWFYLTYSLRVYYVLQYKIIENCLKAIKDTISKNRIINLEYILCQQNKVNIRILISKIFKWGFENWNMHKKFTVCYAKCTISLYFYLKFKDYAHISSSTQKQLLWG